MLWVYGHYKYFNSFQCGDRLYASGSDVYIHWILTYKAVPRAERGDHSDYITRGNNSHYQQPTLSLCNLDKEIMTG